MEAVQVEAVKANALTSLHHLVIEGAKPLYKRQHIHVAPHPGGKSGEAAKCRHRIGIRSPAFNIAIYAISIWPITLDCYRLELLLLDQPLCDQSTFSIKIMCSMGSFAEQHQRPIPDPVKQRVVIAEAERQRNCGTVDFV